MSTGIIVAQNSCYVPKFTLFVYRNTNTSQILPVEDFLEDNSFECEILNLKQSLIQKDAHIGIIENKICFDQKKVFDEGFLKFKTRIREVKVAIFLRYQITDDIGEGYNVNNLIEELNSIRLKFETSLLISEQNFKVNHFLRPHMSGVRGDLYTLSNPIEISYELDGKYVKLKNYSKESLVEYTRSFKFHEEDHQIIPIKIKNEIFDIQWNRTLEAWELLNEYSDFPRTGNFKVGRGIDKNYDRNKRHDFNKLNRMKICLGYLKTNPYSYGGKTLLDLVAEIQLPTKTFSRKENQFTTIKNIINNSGLRNLYKQFDEQQKKVLSDIFTKNIVILNGEGGSGKTEIAAFLTLVYLIMGKRVLVTTETRNALDNILTRISTLSENSSISSCLLNIVRVENRSPLYEKEDLENWGMSNEIQKISTQIAHKTQDKTENDQENYLKTCFRKEFTKSKKIERLIALSYKVVLSSYGLICERKYFIDPVQKFDLNIVEASSSTNFSSIATSIMNSKKWLFLNDNAQISPLTVGDYLLKQQLRFPNHQELQNAKKFNPKDLSLRKASKFWSNRDYSKGVVSLFEQFKQNNLISFLKLNNQYRINPVLYHNVNEAFGNQSVRYSSKKAYANLADISPLLNTKSHLKYEIMSQEEILDNMGKKVSALMKSIEELNNFSQNLTIGIACTDVNSLRKVVEVYNQSRKQGNTLRKISTNHYCEQNNHLNLTFCSIKSHQEREYDIFLLGIVKYRSFDFKKRLYTALSRASNYIVIFGPLMKNTYRKGRSHLQKNKNVLSRLERGSNG